jgi:hypothetical protein
MTIEGIYPYYLRTSTTTDGTGYPTLEASKTALRHLLAREQGKGHNVVEQKGGRWVTHQLPTGSVTMWIEDEAGNTIRLG